MPLDRVRDLPHHKPEPQMVKCDCRAAQAVEKRVPVAPELTGSARSPILCVREEPKHAGSGGSAA